MLSARGNAQPGEPPAKKLRIAKQKPGIIHQLPSPDAALGSSSQTAGLPSSTSPKRKFSQSFRDRIFTQNDDPLVEVPNNLPSQQKARPKTTIAPIFKQNITSSFQAAPQSSYRVPSARLAPIRELSPETDPEDLIKRLKSLFLNPSPDPILAQMISDSSCQSITSTRPRPSTSALPFSSSRHTRTSPVNSVRP